MNSKIRTEEVEISVSDGTQMSVFSAYPEGVASTPGMMIFQEIFGVNSHMRNVARRFAEIGFYAVVPDLFHRSAPGFQGSYDDMSPGVAQKQKMTDPGLEADILATYEWLSAKKIASVAAVGFCMGGRVAFQANALLPLKAAISFYGSGISTDYLRLAAAQKAPLLLFWGGRDKHIRAEHLRLISDTLKQSNKDFVNVEFGGADHGFFCDERAAFHPSSASQAWALLCQFLKEQGFTL